MTPEERLVFELGERAVEAVTRRVIRRLQQEPAHIMGGGDSHLKTTWDEICVKVQFGKAVMWDSWEHFIDQVIYAVLESVPTLEQQAMFLGSREGTKWSVENQDTGQPIPVDPDTIAHAVRVSTLTAASNWSNRAIREQEAREFLD